MSLVCTIFCATSLLSCGPTPVKQSSGAHLAVQQPAKTPITYVAIGASDTFGTGTEDPQEQSWPTEFSKKLGKGVHLVNLGIPGIHAHDALKTEVPVALDAHPTLVTVWLAVNDLVDAVPVESYAQDVELVIVRLQTLLPSTHILVANVPDITLLPRFQNGDSASLHQRIAMYNTAIAKLVERHHVLLVDLSQRWKELADHPGYISGDGFHPNAIGYARLAEIFYQVFQKQYS